MEPGTAKLEKTFDYEHCVQEWLLRETIPHRPQPGRAGQSHGTAARSEPSLLFDISQHQVPGKPKINKTLVSEMEGMLAKRRSKVDQEAYVSEGPDPVLPPPEPVCLPPTGARKPSVASVDSGRGASIESNSRNSLEPGGYARVSVDQERKEELMLAKAVRRSSAKMLARDASPNSMTSPIESPVTVKQEVSSSLPPPSSVVMRYWKQCSSTADSGFFGEEGMEQDEPAARGVSFTLRSSSDNFYQRNLNAICQMLTAR